MIKLLDIGYHRKYGTRNVIALRMMDETYSVVGEYVEKCIVTSVRDSLIIKDHILRAIFVSAQNI